MKIYSIKNKEFFSFSIYNRKLIQEFYKEKNIMAFLNSDLIGRIRKIQRQFLQKEKNISALLYFLMFLFFHFPFENPLKQFEFLLFTLAVVSTFACHFNFVYTVCPFLSASPLLSVPMVAITLLFCNQEWKMLLFLFAIGDNLFQDSSQQFFLAVFSLLVCFIIYRSLVFRTIQENIQFFVGMATISSNYFLIIVSNNLSLQIFVGIHVMMVLSLAFLAYLCIDNRVEELMATNPDQIFSDSLMAHYLKMLQQNTDLPLLQTKILCHSRNCDFIDCFCHRKDLLNNNTNHFFKQIYENAFNRFKNKQTNNSLLYENYVQFLMKNQQMMKALHFLSRFEPNGFFSYMAKERMHGKIERIIDDINSFNKYQVQYQYSLEYDKHCQSTKTKINQILKLKLQFWGEVNQESPKVIRMQELGSEIITQMYDLNQFYSKVIKKYEKSLFLFDASNLYSMYMLSTTNFKEYAELIIKNTSRLRQQTYVLENINSQTYAIQTLALQEKYNHNDHKVNNLKPIQKRQISPKHQLNENIHQCKLVIDAVSSGLCKTIGIPKSDLIGLKLETIIPDGYKEVHNVRLNSLLNFGNGFIQQFVPSRVMHKELNLPIKAANKKMVIGHICIKFLMAVEKGLSLISIVQVAKQKSHLHAIMDLSGQITQSQQGFNKTIIQHSEFQRYFQLIQRSWKEEKTIPSQNFTLVMNSLIYAVTISSPLVPFFLGKGKLEKEPPIHVQIFNQQFKTTTIRKNQDNKAGTQFKQAQNAIHTSDIESQAASSRGGSSAITIISNFSQGNSTKHYNLLQLAFLAIILGCIGSNFSTYFITRMPWDPCSPRNNPLNDTMNMYALQMLTVKGYISITVQQQYNSVEIGVNKTRISEYFGTKDSNKAVQEYDENLKNAFKESIKNCLQSPSELLKPIITERFQTPLRMLYPGRYAPVLNSSNSQVVTYLDLLMIFVTDFDLMAQLKFNNLILQYSFVKTLVDVQKVTNLSTIIEDAVNQRQRTSLIVHFTLMSLIVVLLILFSILLRKRLPLHQKIVDLFASIDGEQVNSQIRSLDAICNILQNCNKQDEMKMNVVDYQANRNCNKRKSIVINNQIIQLQKTKILPQPLQDNKQNIPAKIGSHGVQPQSNTKNMHNSIIKPSNKGCKVEQKRKNMMDVIKRCAVITQPERRQSTRKRSGDLDFTDSILDPSRKMIKDHCILYFLSLSFLLILGISLLQHKQYNHSYLLLKNQLIDIYNDQIDFEYELIVSKYFLQAGSKPFAKTFGVSDAMAHLYQMITQYPAYKYYDGSSFFSDIRPNCSIEASNRSTFQAKFCQNDYSEVILRGKFGAMIKQLMEFRYMLDSNIGNLNSTVILTNITEKLFYIVSLNLVLEGLVLQKVQLIFDQTMRQGTEYESTKTVMLVVSVLWGSLCFVWGLVVVLRMKRMYFREVYMLSFLNSQMIAKNKRVKSFLEEIARNNSR